MAQLCSRELSTLLLHAARSAAPSFCARSGCYVVRAAVAAPGTSPTAHTHLEAWLPAAGGAARLRGVLLYVHGLNEHGGRFAPHAPPL
jgi:hypothetical protein